MDTPHLPQTYVPTYPEFGTVQTRFFVASFNLMFVLAAGGLMYFYAISGPGVDLLVVPIRIFCIFGGLTAGCAWIFSWVQLVRMKSDFEKFVS